MESNDIIMSNAKLTWAQKLVFKILRQIKFGQITIHDANGIHIFSGQSATTTHAVRITVHDISGYRKILLNGSIAAGDTYVEGNWDVDDLTKFIEIIIKNTEIFVQIDAGIAKFLNLILRFCEIFRSHNIQQNKQYILAHYDLGNEFFNQFLDSSMMYSCALFEPENISLAEAAVKKMERICQQLQLRSSDHLLEIGTGWGGFAIYAAQQYGCKVTTTTISDKQYAYVKAQIEQLGLQHNIELLNRDYQLLEGQYDKLVSIEMIEAIGYQYFDTFFQKCNALVKPKGLFFLQAILINDQAYARAKIEVDFIRKYIFPGGCLPSMNAISNSIAKKTQFQLINFQDIGQHYSTTLSTWQTNFNQHLEQIKQQGFSEQFIRTWHYYFSYCIAAFRQHYITDIHALWRKRE